MANTNVHWRSLIVRQVDPSSPCQLTRPGPLDARLFAGALYLNKMGPSSHIWSLRKAGRRARRPLEEWLHPPAPVKGPQRKLLWLESFLYRMKLLQARPLS